MLGLKTCVTIARQNFDFEHQNPATLFGFHNFPPSLQFCAEFKSSRKLARRLHLFVHWFFLVKFRPASGRYFSDSLGAPVTGTLGCCQSPVSGTGRRRTRPECKDWKGRGGAGRLDLPVSGSGRRLTEPALRPGASGPRSAYCKGRGEGESSSAEVWTFAASVPSVF